MSEGLAHDERASAARSRPAYGDGRLTYEAPKKLDESLRRRDELMLVLAIFGPALAAYAAVGYAIYILVSRSL